jgi:hypothetical protein
MQALFKGFAESIALAVEVAAALIIAYGAIEALYGSIRSIVAKGSKAAHRKDVG